MIVLFDWKEHYTEKVHSDLIQMEEIFETRNKES